MRRYLHTLGLFWSASLAAELEYRVNFVVATLTATMSLVGGLFAMSIFYGTGYTFAGWTWNQALLVLGVWTIMDGISSTCLSPNLNKIVLHVQQGTLDFVLLKPIDSQFFVSLRNFSPWGVPNIIFGVALVIYGGSQSHLPWQAYALGLAPLALGVCVLYSLWFALATTTIWFTKIFNATEVLRGLLEAGRSPISAYSAGHRFFFTFIVPVAFLTTVPAEWMLGRSSVGWLLAAALLAAALLLASRAFWKFALRFYHSASS